MTATKDLWLVHYIDATTHEGTSEHAAVKVMPTAAVGFLLAEDETGIALTPELFDDGQHRYELHIPTGCIVHKEKLWAVRAKWMDLSSGIIELERDTKDE